MKLGSVDIAAMSRQLELQKHKAGVFTALAVVLGLVAIALPWYGLDDLQGGIHNPYRGYGLAEWTEWYPGGTRGIVPYDAIDCRCASVGGAFLTAQLLVWLGVILGALTVALRLRGALKGDATVVMTAVVGLLLIGAPLSLAVSLTGAFARDNQDFQGLDPPDNFGSSFVGSNQTTGRVISWGPAAGFALSFGAGLCALVAVFLRRQGAKPAPAPMQTWQPGVPPAPAAPAPTQPQSPSSGGSP